MANIKTNYKDYIPPASGKKYKITANVDGSSSIDDITQYEQVGDTFAANDINATNLIVNNALSKTDGGTVNARVMFSQGTSVHKSEYFGSNTGFFKICRMEITGTYQDQSIAMEIVQRKYRGTVTILFLGGESKDPILNKFLFTGNIVPYMKRISTSVWELYVKTSGTYDYIEVTSLSKGEFSNGITITWTQGLVPTLTGATEAIDETLTTKLLWTNASLGSIFASQVFSFPMDYDYYMVVSIDNTTSQRIIAHCYTDFKKISYLAYYDETAAQKYNRRTVYAYSTTAIGLGENTNSANQNNIPYKIYGFKGVK